jgi:hypothetical protein
MQARMRCVLYCNIDIFADPRHAGRKTGRGALCQSIGKQYVYDTPKRRLSRGLQEPRAFGRDVWKIF